MVNPELIPILTKQVFEMVKKRKMCMVACVITHLVLCVWPRGKKHWGSVVITASGNGWVRSLSLPFFLCCVACIFNID